MKILSYIFIVTARKILLAPHVRFPPLWHKVWNCQGGMNASLASPFGGFSLSSLAAVSLWWRSASCQECVAEEVLFTWWLLGSRMRKREELKSQYPPSLQLPDFLYYASTCRGLIAFQYSTQWETRAVWAFTIQTMIAHCQNNGKKNLNAMVKLELLFFCFLDF